MTKAFQEFIYRSQQEYLKNLKEDTTIKLGWSWYNPEDVNKITHYNNGIKALLKIINDNIEYSETSILLVPPAFLTAMYCSDNFTACEDLYTTGICTYGTLCGITVASNISLDSNKIILLDLLKNKSICIEIEEK